MNLSLVLSVIISSVAMTPLSGLVTLVVETNGQLFSKYMNEEEIPIILGYCYQHADRPNPVQDLVDKGLVSAEFSGDTCASVKQGNDKAKEVTMLQMYDDQRVYHDCLEGGNDILDCSSLISTYCHNPAYARYIVQDCLGMTGKQESSPYAQLNNETK